MSLINNRKNCISIFLVLCITLILSSCATSQLGEYIEPELAAPHALVIFKIDPGWKRLGVIPREVNGRSLTSSHLWTRQIRVMQGQINLFVMVAMTSESFANAQLSFVAQSSEVYTVEYNNDGGVINVKVLDRAGNTVTSAIAIRS